jgi:hypothetical protein
MEEEAWIPFVSASYSTTGRAGIGGGMFYHDVGIQARYFPSGREFDLGVMYKF